MAGTGAPRGENQGGGPKTPAGAARALANLSPDGSITHGLTRYLSRSIAPPCNRCAARSECEEFTDGATCAIAERHQAAIVQDLRALPHLGDVDLPLVHEFAKIATAILIADTYLARTGPLLPGADVGMLEYQPAMATRLKLSERLAKLASDLALTPMMRAKLAQKAGPGETLAATLAEIEAEDAEFTSEEVPTDGPH